MGIGTQRLNPSYVPENKTGQEKTLSHAEGAQGAGNAINSTVGWVERSDTHQALPDAAKEPMGIGTQRLHPSCTFENGAGADFDAINKHQQGNAVTQATGLLQDQQTQTNPASGTPTGEFIDGNEIFENVTLPGIGNDLRGYFYNKDKAFQAVLPDGQVVLTNGNPASSYWQGRNGQWHVRVRGGAPGSGGSNSVPSAVIQNLPPQNITVPFQQHGNRIGGPNGQLTTRQNLHPQVDAIVSEFPREVRSLGEIYKRLSENRGLLPQG